MKRRHLLVLLLGVLAPAGARADEGGVSFWIPGQYASLAAVPSKPGIYVPVIGYFWAGSASADKTFTRGEAVVTGLDSRVVPLVLVQPTYAPDFKIAGGQLSVGLGFGAGVNTTQADVTVSSSGTERDRKDTVSGPSDLYPIASIAWGSGSNNGMGYVTGVVPFATYDKFRLSNIGLGHRAIDFGGAYTYLNQKSGLEGSAVTGFTFNAENPKTRYKNGVDWHLDWAVSQFLSNHWDVGVVGYLYHQLTADSGPGARIPDFKSAVAAVGPEVNYLFGSGALQGSASLRGYWEFWSMDRLKGGAVFAVVAIPTGLPKRSAP